VFDAEDYGATEKKAKKHTHKKRDIIDEDVFLTRKIFLFGFGKTRKN